MSGVKSGLSKTGDKLFLIFEAEETTMVEMSLDTAKKVQGLLHQLIDEAKATQDLFAMNKKSLNRDIN